MLKTIISTVKKWFSVREAAGQTTFANEDIGWTPLSGDKNRDLMPYDQRRMQDMAVYLWGYNMIANRMIELKVAHLLGGGVSWKVASDDPDLQSLIDQKVNDFWHFPTNQMDKFLIQFIRELGIYGEVCLPMFVSPYTGTVRIGYIPAVHIEEVIMSDDGRSPIIIKTTQNQAGKCFQLKIIYSQSDETLFSEQDQYLRQLATDGECFFFAINNLIGSKRGRSDLAASFDWLDLYETFMFGEVERANISRTFMWDVKVTGATQEEITARAKATTAPKPASVRFHNENEEWKAESPSMGAYESAAAARLFRNHILAGNTIPEHWIGGGGDANRSTAEAMDDPTYKIFSMRQRELKQMVEEILNYVARQYFIAMGMPNQQTPEIHAIFPEMNPKDNSRYAAAFQQLTAGIVMNLQQNLISPETAIEILNTISSQMGVDIDAAIEIEKAQNAMLAQAQNDLYSEQPAVTDDAVA